MTTDLLDLYQEAWERTLAWLKDPLSKQDLKPVLQLVRTASEKAMSLIDLSKLGLVAERMRRRAHAIAIVTASQAFRALAIVLGEIATRRAALLSNRYGSQASVQIQGKRESHPAKALETTFWLVAVGTLGYCSVVCTNSVLYQAQRTDLFDGLRTANPSDKSPFGLSPGPPHIRGTHAEDGKLLGFLDIPKIGMSSVVEEGAAPNIVARGVAHVSGTALPGEHGNVRLTGRLDSYFDDLSKLHAGDKLTFRSTTATYDYSVVSAHIADTAENDIVGGSAQPTLTLVSYSPLQNPDKSAKQLVVVAQEASARGANTLP